MTNSAKIGIIGAGSAEFSAGIVRDLCVCKELENSHICFMDVNVERLNNIHSLAEKITRELGCKLTFEKTTVMEDAVRGMDFVINTAQIGGHSWVEAQREMAERHGYYRGIRLYSIGQMLFFLDVAKMVEALAPNAWLIQSANPVFEGCTLMSRETRVKTVGLCHGHYGYRRIAEIIGLPWEDISANMIGFNHWIWMTEFRYKGKDAYPLIDEWIETKGEDFWKKHRPHFTDTQMSRAAVEQYKLYGLFPIGDTPRFGAWWQNDSLESKREYFGYQGGFDSEIGWQLYLDNQENRVKEIDKAVKSPKIRATDMFEPKQSDEQIIPIINSIINDKPAIYQVNIPNTGGVIQGFPEDLVIECRGIADATGIKAIMEPPLPESILTGVMNPHWAQAEAKIYAAKTCTYNAFRSFLLLDRRTSSLKHADDFLEEWLNDPRNEIVRSRMC